MSTFEERALCVLQMLDELFDFDAHKNLHHTIKYQIGDTELARQTFREALSLIEDLSRDTD